MTNPLKLIYKISRFRFWIYTGGTYVVGYALGFNSIFDFFKLDYYVYLVYFFLLANIFIYGVNDYWDKETDKNNPKKEEKEYRVEDKERKSLLRTLYFVGIISLILMVFQDNIERLIFLIFLFLSYFYSAKPLRFKQVPFLDFSSNYLYVMPGIFSYYMISKTLPPLIFLLGAFFHIAAMHIFSAIPDIQYDKEAEITTTPVFIGKRLSLLLCLIFWGILSGIVLVSADFNPLSYLVLIYPIFPLLLLLRKELKVEKLYWYLPYINTTLGGLLFTSLVLYKTFLI
ncbi:MAG TPA: prenyltransferase [Methanofastidiosum sp.]|nr:prenyltransferase [Methanofastidiosum sp.]HNU62503.1 prenyltransferase [Methanofastidiosum sp.]HOI76005.1 prenyltransferase [Methanofastidiosum sp.]